MTTSHTNSNPTTPVPMCYESGGADPDFYFPAAASTNRASYRDRISTLHSMVLRIIRR